MMIEKGLCQCGCGGETSIANRNRPEYGWVKGEPMKFINHHFQKAATGRDNPNWGGGVRTRPDGYVRILSPANKKPHIDGYIYEHRDCAEKALGKPLPLKSVVHHHTPGQLVICQDQAYHKLLHQRQRAYLASGHTKWLKCAYCGQYDDPISMYVRPNGSQGWHRSCLNKRNRERGNNV